MVTLPPRLEEVLASIADRPFANRLREVHLASAQAISRLAAMDLVKYETGEVDEAPDLALWEQMAPAIRDLVMDVNAVLLAARSQFPVGTVSAAGGAVGGEAWRRAEAEGALHASVERIAADVTQLGERMRSPEVVADRWTLLADLQSFRSRFREEISRLVHATAAAYADVRYEDVVPRHVEELQAAVAVRSTVSDLIRVVNARLTQLSAAEPEDILWHAQQVERELDTFGRTPAYRALRAQDKRRIVELRQTVGQLATRSQLSKVELLETFEPFVEFIRSLHQVNNRELLLVHDREVAASCAVKLERAMRYFDADLAVASRVMAEAAALGQMLYGRDRDLDGFLRRWKKQSMESTSKELLRGCAEEFLNLLAKLDLY